MINDFLYSYKKIAIVYFFIVLANILFLGSYNNLIVSSIQYIVVFRCLLNKKYEEAIFYHLSFIITSIAPTTLLSVQDDISIPLLNYARIKIGPVCLHYIISLILLFLSNGRSISIQKDSLFYQLYRVFLFLAVTGFVLGLVGFTLLSHYDLSSFLLYGTYIFIVIINMLVLQRYDTPRLYQLIRRNLPPIMGGAILATAVCYFLLGISGAYGELNMVLQPDIVYFGILFLLGFYESKYKLFVLIVSILYIVMNLIGATGHNIIIVALGLVYFLYHTYFSSEIKQMYPTSVTRARRLFIILIPFIVFAILSYVSMGDLFLIKLNNVFSLFSTDVSEVDTSPYVRIATTMNIWDNNKYNPIAIIFGQGYGGYFTDSLHMFGGIDLTDGGWPLNDVRTGRFTRGHDTFATVPLVNGFGGLLFLILIIFKYAKFTCKSYMAYAIFPWVVFTFYFNINYAIIGICYLYAADTKLRYTKQNLEKTIAK